MISTRTCLTHALKGLGCLCAAFLATAAAAEDCTQWDVPAGYSLDQDNGYKVELLNGLSGKAQYWPSTTRSPIVNGDVFDGVVSTKKISFKIHWQNGAVGAYDGDITRKGYVRGTTRDQSGASAGFVGRILKCAASAPPPQDSSPLRPKRGPFTTRQPDVIRRPDGGVR
jgi:hypothetical protein